MPSQPRYNEYQTQRTCQGCGKVYFRVNKMRVWTAVNHGHRAGWIVEVVKICTRCMNAQKAQRIVMLAGPNVLLSAVR